MEKLYLGVDLHKRSCWVTVLDADGHLVESRKLGTEKWELEEFFGKVAKPAALAVEATFNWYYFLNVIEPLGLELHLVHPWKTRAIASARIKHDKLDSRVLAELLRTGFLAEAWIAPRAVREQRQLLRYRVHTVQWATRAKNSIHGVLNRNGIRLPLGSPFGPRGREFLSEVELPETDRWEVSGQLVRLDLLRHQLGELDREIRKRSKASPIAQALEQIPGIGPFIASLLIAEIGDIWRFPTAKHLASYTGLVPSLYASGEHRWGEPSPNKVRRCCAGRWCRRRTAPRSARAFKISTNGSEPATAPARPPWPWLASWRSLPITAGGRLCTLRARRR